MKDELEKIKHEITQEFDSCSFKLDHKNKNTAMLTYWYTVRIGNLNNYIVNKSS